MKSTSKPHIIFIMTDQQRGDTLGCTGNRIIKTPHIDQLAKEGVVFKNAYTSAPSCTPARAGLLTGMKPWNHGMLGYGRVGENYKYELPRMVRHAGYYTFGIGKMHWFPQKTTHGFHGTLVDESGRVESKEFVSDYHQWFQKEAPGKDPNATGIGWNENKHGQYVLDERLHPTSWTGDQAVKKIQKHDPSKPLFLKVSFARPHSPYDAPKRFAEQYNWENMPDPVIGDWCDFQKEFRKQKNPYFGDFGMKTAKKARQYYYGNITFIDEQVGKIKDVLKEKGMYDNSFIFFTADHGDMLGDHYHWRKTYAYEGSANIPMLMKWPRDLETYVEKGSEMKQVTELRDILPTLLDITGQKIPDEMDGDSLLKLITEKNPKWREWVDLEHSTCYHKRNYWMALTDGKMKYIYFRSTGNEQLFNLKKDPGEIHDLADDPDYEEELEKWRSRMIDHLSERGKGWVKDGKLQTSKKGMLYGPNYPDYKESFFQKILRKIRGY